MGSLVKSEEVKAGARHAIAGATEPQQYLTFVLNDEMYGIGTHGVREIIEYEAVTAVPMMPKSIRGVVNLRGAVVPVIDLSSRFGGKQTEVGRRTCIVFLDVKAADEELVIGVVVDAVSEVLEIAGSDIEPPPSFGARIRTDFIAGMAKVDKKFVILLEIAEVLSVDELSTLVEVAANADVGEMQGDA